MVDNTVSIENTQNMKIGWVTVIRRGCGLALWNFKNRNFFSSIFVFLSSRLTT
jgi:hypothetical protein